MDGGKFLEFTEGVGLLVKLWSPVTKSVPVCKWAMRSDILLRKVVLIIWLVKANISREMWEGSNGFVLQRWETM